MKRIAGESTSVTRKLVVASPLDQAHCRQATETRATIGRVRGTRLTESNGNKEIKTTGAGISARLSEDRGVITAVSREVGVAAWSEVL